MSVEPKQDIYKRKYLGWGASSPFAEATGVFKTDKVGQGGSKQKVSFWSDVFGEWPQTPEKH